MNDNENDFVMWTDEEHIYHLNSRLPLEHKYSDLTFTPIRDLKILQNEPLDDNAKAQYILLLLHYIFTYWALYSDIDKANELIIFSPNFKTNEIEHFKKYIHRLIYTDINDKQIITSKELLHLALYEPKISKQSYKKYSSITSSLLANLLGFNYKYKNSRADSALMMILSVFQTSSSKNKENNFIYFALTNNYYANPFLMIDQSIFSIRRSWSKTIEKINFSLLDMATNKELASQIDTSDKKIHKQIVIRYEDVCLLSTFVQELVIFFNDNKFSNILGNKLDKNMIAHTINTIFQALLIMYVENLYVKEYRSRNHLNDEHQKNHPFLSNPTDFDNSHTKAYAQIQHKINLKTENMDFKLKSDWSIDDVQIVANEIDTLIQTENREYINITQRKKQTTSQNRSSANIINDILTHIMKKIEENRKIRKTFKSTNLTDSLDIWYFLKLYASIINTNCRQCNYVLNIQIHNDHKTYELHKSLGCNQGDKICYTHILLSVIEVLIVDIYDLTPLLKGYGYDNTQQDKQQQ